MRILLEFIFCLPMLCQVSYAQTAMLVHHNGEIAQYDISSIEKITFDLDNPAPDIEKLNQIVKSFQ